jgi:hypothetical protein
MGWQPVESDFAVSVSARHRGGMFPALKKPAPPVATSAKLKRSGFPLSLLSEARAKATKIARWQTNEPIEEERSHDRVWNGRIGIEKAQHPRLLEHRRNSFGPLLVL